MKSSSSGPISEIVARTGCPSCPNTSQNVAGHPANVKSPSFNFFMRSAIFELLVPGWLIPDKSPLMSAANTGTPIRLKPSANTCNVTVFPVPVAPAISPCRFAICGNRLSWEVPCAMQSGSTMVHPLRRSNPAAIRNGTEDSSALILIRHHPFRCARPAAQLTTYPARKYSPSVLPSPSPGEIRSCVTDRYSR